jgi:iron complex outermembrane receptor protein
MFKTIVALLTLVIPSLLFHKIVSRGDSTLATDSFPKNTIVAGGSGFSVEDLGKQITAPVSISKWRITAVQSASPSFFEAVGTMKAVQVIVPSMGFKVLNTRRGFSNHQQCQICPAD